MLLKLKSPYLVPEMTTDDIVGGEHMNKLSLLDKDFNANVFCYLCGLYQLAVLNFSVLQNVSISPSKTQDLEVHLSEPYCFLSHGTRKRHHIQARSLDQASRCQRRLIKGLDMCEDRRCSHVWGQRGKTTFARDDSQFRLCCASSASACYRYALVRTGRLQTVYCPVGRVRLYYEEDRNPELRNSVL